MGPGRARGDSGLLLRPPFLLLLLPGLLSAGASSGAWEGAAAPAPEEAKYLELSFFLLQESLFFPSEEGELLQAFQEEEEEEEVFHVDWGRRETLWRLPEFPSGSIASYEASGALAGLSVTRNNLEALVKLSNRTTARPVAPSAQVFPKGPVELGEPNVLICLVDKFSPPVVNVSWMKNGEEVSEGVQETGFYPSADFTFRKFSYLPFVPEDGDFYACQVDHWGLREPLTKIWYSKEPTPLPETSENLLCGLGLAVGILGIVTGTVLFFKAVRMNDHSSRSRDGL